MTATQEPSAVEDLAIDMPWGRFAYRRTGSGSPLLLLHSLALDARMWEPILPELADGHDVIMVDFRGHGRSNWDGGPFTIDDLATDLTSLLDALEIHDCGVLGLSMGGSVAIVLAQQDSRVRRLALCDTTAWYGPDAPTAWAARAEAAHAPDRRSLLPFQTERWFTDSFQRTAPAVVEHVADLFLHTDPAAHAQACRALGALDARSRLDEVAAESLVVTGEQDYATPPSMGAALAQAIPNARFVLWSGVRHLSVFENGELRAALHAHLGPIPAG